MFNLFHLTFAKIFHTISFSHAHENFPPLSAPFPIPNISCLSSANHKSEVQLVKTCCSKRNVPSDLFLFFAGRSNVKFPLLQSQEPFSFSPSVKPTQCLWQKKKKKKILSQITLVDNGSSAVFCETNEAMAFPFPTI